MLKHAAGGVLLIAGTCVGAGTLALPMGTAHLSLTHGLLLFVLCWTFMTLSALLMLESNLRIAPGHNLVSMAEQTLGTPGKIIAWLSYLLLFYSLTAAYLNGAGTWMQARLEELTALQVSFEHAAIVLGVLVAAVVHAGPKAVDWTNRVFMLGLAIAFGTLLFDTAPHFSLTQAVEKPGTFDPMVLPLLLTTFGYHIVIPTLTTYIQCDKRLKSIILIGSLIPLVVYLLWETWVFGLLSPQTLETVATAEAPAVALVEALQNMSHHSRIGMTASAFTIFLIATSFLGVTLSLFDFITDALKVKAEGAKRYGLTFLTFFPPLCIVILLPSSFLFALSFAGIFVAILLGVYPALMVWRARYHQNRLCEYAVFGGKPILAITMAFFAGVIALELVHLCG